MSQIIYHQEGPIGWIILNDPDRLNALTEEMGREILRLVPIINKNKEVRVVILTGSGRAFSAGGNLEIIIARTKKKSTVNEKEMIGFYHRFLSLRQINVPVIAMINGPAIGAAFCMSVACDLRTASTDAKMGVNFVKIGLSPGMGGTFLLPQTLGIPIAADLLLTGRTISAEEAFQKGIVHRLHSPETLKEETVKLALEIAANAPLAVRAAKQGIQNHMKAINQALKFESKGQAACFKTHDIVEGITAIRAKRKPNFQGN
jgi:enoyl-CoA hydratase